MVDQNISILLLVVLKLVDQSLHSPMDRNVGRDNHSSNCNNPVTETYTDSLRHYFLSPIKIMKAFESTILYCRYIGEMKTERAHGPPSVIPSNVQKKKNPIITVTEHTPSPSPDYLSKTGQVRI